MIIIFGNKMGLLKLNFPLININTKSFKEYNIDSLVIEIDNCWKNMDIDKNVKLSELYSYYLEKLFENKKLEIINMMILLIILFWLIMMVFLNN